MSKKNSKELRNEADHAELEDVEQQTPDGGGAPLLVHLQALRRVLIVSAAASVNVICCGNRNPAITAAKDASHVEIR